MVDYAVFNKPEIIAWLANKAHAHALKKLSPDVSIEDRFNSGDREVIIEIYGERILAYSDVGVLRFKLRPSEGIDLATRTYFLKRSVKALAKIMSRNGARYDPIMIAAAVMDEFCALPQYSNFYLLL